MRTVWLENRGAEPCRVRLLDGVRNLLPYGATTVLQTTMSNLLNAYKRNELDPATGLGIFALSATLTDRAEPSESLKATVAWQVGLEHADAPALHAATRSLPAWGGRCGRRPMSRAQRGAYLSAQSWHWPAGEERQWSLVADVNQDHSQVGTLLNRLRGE